MSTRREYVKNEHGAVDYAKPGGLLKVADVRRRKLAVENEDVNILRLGKLLYLLKLAPADDGGTVVLGALLNDLCHDLGSGGFRKLLKLVNGNLRVPLAAVRRRKYGALGFFFVFKHKFSP